MVLVVMCVALALAAVPSASAAPLSLTEPVGGKKTKVDALAQLFTQKVGKLKVTITKGKKFCTKKGTTIYFKKVGSCFVTYVYSDTGVAPQTQKVEWYIVDQ